MSAPPCRVRREGLIGPVTAAATALDGTQIVCAYEARQLQQVLVVSYPLLTEEERDMLETSLSTGMVRDVAGYACVPAEKSAHRFEPIWGDYPDTAAPQRLRLWRAEVKYYIVGGG